MKLGDHIKWQAIRRIREGMIVGVEGDLLTVRDEGGIMWFVNREEILECH